MRAPEWAKYIRPDEVAECWDGVIGVAGLYEDLWRLVPSRPSYQENIEDVGPADVVGLDSLAGVWGRLGEDHQASLVRLAAENGVS